MVLSRSVVTRNFSLWLGHCPSFKFSLGWKLSCYAWSCIQGGSERSLNPLPVKAERNDNAVNPEQANHPPQKTLKG